MLNWMRNEVNQQLYGYAPNDVHCATEPLFIIKYTPMLNRDIGDFALYRASIRGVMVSTGEYLRQLNSENQARGNADNVYRRDLEMAFEG